MPPSEPARRRWIHLSLGWFVLSAALLVWPLYPALGNSIEPRVAGLPWSLVYVLAVVVANAVVLAALHAAHVLGDREVDAEAGDA